MTAVFRKHSFAWENLPQYFKSPPFYTTDSKLISQKNYSILLKMLRLQKSQMKIWTKICLMKTTQAEFWLIYQKITSKRELQFVKQKKIVPDFRFSIFDALLTFKQQLTDITKSCGKVAPSDGDKQHRKMLTKIVLVWVDKQTIKKIPWDKHS